MKASELVSELSSLIEEHGQLDVYCDCDSILTELAAVVQIGKPHFDPPVFVIQSVPHGPDVSNDSFDAMR